MMKCFLCGEQMKEVITDYASRWGSYELTITGIKAFKCKKCGRLVFEAHKAERMQALTA